MSNEEKHKISVLINSEQYNLARRRLFAEHQTWQSVMNALINAYITGDITITQAGRYHLKPPSDKPLSIKVPRGAENIDVDVDWGPITRPQVGATDKRQHPKVTRAWGTKDLARYLREETGRRISLQTLRYMLGIMEIEKKENNRWEFTGPDDSRVAEVLDAMNNGLYDELVRLGTESAKAIQEVKKREKKQLQQAALAMEAEQKRLYFERLKVAQSEGS